ncbi:hypothetical protein M409DRAFT_16506 [Zasmidium cellare ATCC 36951]|uniref:BRCT domain-containing protein n=1 Tax=Zasmidium cellare ATCC 36951 TaxID=1080233 RepID=A0A6A6D495_ZASCE|nr:uncharacterized protein M409DRAFT_16506 [Zasmidium cellare ATCC 36951]KAF2174244.1 hypothetical protein M409DRAFT_16506 [Zasmidium cellare ATCC 36951]
MPTAPPAAKPTKQIFDPFNSSATGHQRAENRLSGSTSWRDSRHQKLCAQFASGAGGGKRVSDSVGAGSRDFGVDGRTENGGWEKGAKGLRTGGQLSLWESVRVEKKDQEEGRPAKRVKAEQEEKRKPSAVVNPYTPVRKQDGSIRESSWTSHETSPSDLLEPIDPIPPSSENVEEPSKTPPSEKDPPQIFSSLTFYINGSTAPILSDHKLKNLLTLHGGSIAIALGRRTVTHVILGKANCKGGIGGGLAASKIQKEIASVKGAKVRFVTVEWVVESIKAGKRLQKGRFEAVGMRPAGVAGIEGMFGKKK